VPIFMKPTSIIIADLGLQDSGPVHATFTNSCRNHMDKYVPYSGDTGRIHLRENVAMTKSTITYKMPYAHAQYVGYTKGPVNNYTTPGTGPYWDKLMWSAEKNEVIEEVRNYFKRRGGR